MHIYNTNNNKQSTNNDNNDNTNNIISSSPGTGPCAPAGPEIRHTYIYIYIYIYIHTRAILYCAVLYYTVLLLY